MNRLKQWIEWLYKIIKKYFWDGVVLFIVVTVFWALALRFVPVPITYLMIQRSITDEGSLRYTWTPWEKISPAVKVCTMASEDQSLPFHYGVDFNMMAKAFQTNQRGKKVFGASTITQQVAKNVFLFPNRSYIRKGLELYFSYLIETLWTKERILETYLNIAEMGDLVFGVGEASQYYFGKPASRLNVREAAAIVACLPSPRRYNVKKPGPYVARRQNEIISLYNQLDGTNYLRELYVRSDKSLYDFKKFKK